MESQETSNVSILRFSGRSFSGSCGYCKSTKRAKKVKIGKEANSVQMEDIDKDCGESINFGLMAHLINSDTFNRLLDIGWRLWAHRLTVDSYLALLNKGWRRSGSYLYKPIMEETCCPQYTIRLDVHKFRLSRTQKRVLRTMRDFLKYDKRSSRYVDEEKRFHGTSEQTKVIEPSKIGSTSEIKSPLNYEADNQEEDTKPLKNHDQKKKVRRKKRAEERLKNKGVNLVEYKQRRAVKEESRRRTLDSFFDKYDKDEWKHQLEVRLISVISDDFKDSFDESFAIYKKYQETIHEDDEISRHSFDRFLGTSPFSFPTADSAPVSDDEQLPGKLETAALDMKLGAYHQQYLLDGRIIAVGVVDVLPRCVSSKYFYYDPDYNFLSLGTYSALREINFTKQLSIDRPELHYYYMGYYVYDCPKMRYKGKFRPSDLLCDKTFEWFPLSDCDKMLAANNGKFTTFCNGEMVAGQIDVNAEQVDRNAILADTANCVCNSQPTVISPSLKVMKFGEIRKRYFVPDSMREDMCMLAKYMGSLISDVNILYT